MCRYMEAGESLLFYFVYLCLFLERVEGREGEREGEKHPYERETLIGLPLAHSPTRDGTHNIGRSPDQELNW